MLRGIKSDVVLKAFGLPVGLKLDRCLINRFDFQMNEVTTKHKTNDGKYQKSTKVEYLLTKNGISKLANMSQRCTIKKVNDFASTAMVPLPVVYLFVVVNDQLGIDVPDDCVLVKYGYSNNLQRRMNEHIKTYGDAIFLKYHVYIDPTNLKEAEDEIRQFFKKTKWHVNGSKYSELAIVPMEMLETSVVSEYKRIGEHYLQKITELSSKNKLLNREIEFANKLLAEKERAINLAIEITRHKA